MTILLIPGALCLAWQRDIFVFRTNQKSAFTNVVLLQCKRGTFEEQKESF